METKDLEYALKLVQPCLVGVDFIPIMSHFCFSDGLVYAYDGVFATIVPCDTGLNCGVRGDTLLGMLALAGDKTELSQGKGNVTLTFAKSHAQLPYLPASEFMFQYPEQQEETAFSFTDDIAKGLALCVRGVGQDPRKPEFTGVTMHLGKDAVLYASDNTSVTQYSVTGGVGKKQMTIILPASVCSQILTVAATLEADWKTVHASITAEFILVQFEGTAPEVTIVGKLLAAKPAKFAQIMAAVQTNTPRFKLPESFANAVAKVGLVVSKEVQKDCVLQTKKDTFYVRGSGSLGNVESVFDTDHIVLDDVTVSCSPEHLTKLLADVTHITVSTKAVQMHGPGLEYIVSTRDA